MSRGIIFEDLTTADIAELEGSFALVITNGKVDPGAVDVDYVGDTVTITAGKVTHSFSAETLADASITFEHFNDAELFIFSNDADELTLSSENEQVVHLFDGDDILTVDGQSGSVIAFGGQGSDTIEGGESGDMLIGYGASGDSSLDDGDSLSGGGGNDYIQGNGGDDTLFGGDGRDFIRGGFGNDSIDGGEKNDTINGNKGNDTIAGGLGNDSLSGGQNDDELSGNEGNDILSGDLGDDSLIGGRGLDRLTGGDGADTFGFEDGNASFKLSGEFAGLTDIITDFKIGEDKIVIASFDPETDQLLHIENHLYASFEDALVAAQALLDETGEVRREADVTKVVAVGVGDDTYLFYASDGDDRIDQAIRLDRVYSSRLTSDDFATGGEDDDDGHVILGTEDNDSLASDGGPATIIGGLGQDDLTGSADNDLFFFFRGDAAFEDTGDGYVTDVIHNFDRFTDKIYFSSGDLATADSLIPVVHSLLPGGYSSLDEAADAANNYLETTGSGTTIFALTVGSDIYLFYNDGIENGEDPIPLNSIIKLEGAATLGIDSSNFYFEVL